jgi:hypothetical protein
VLPLHRIQEVSDYILAEGLNVTLKGVPCEDLIGGPLSIAVAHKGNTILFFYTNLKILRYGKNCIRRF